MKNTAIFPGTFDPFTNGHLHIVQRALKIYDRVIVSISDHNKKSSLFTADERVEMVLKALQEAGLEEHTRVEKFDNLLADHAEAMGGRILIRGLRVTSDFEYEYKMAQFIGEMNPNVEVVYLMSTAKTLHISSSSVKEIAALGADISAYLPQAVTAKVKEKYHPCNS